MTVQKETVVTPERLAQGISYKEWMEQIDRNQDKFEQNYAGTEISAEDAAAIKATMAKANGPVTMMAIGEPWCPDVFRGLPVAAKLAEATGLDLKIFFRDQTVDIMSSARSTCSTTPSSRPAWFGQAGATPRSRRFANSWRRPRSSPALLQQSNNQEGPIRAPRFFPFVPILSIRDAPN
jgi:hypothetical protein